MLKLQNIQRLGAGRAGISGDPVRNLAEKAQEIGLNPVTTHREKAMEKIAKEVTHHPHIN